MSSAIILSSPLTNLDDLKPSFEEVDETVDENSIHDKIKDKEVGGIPVDSEFCLT